MSDVINIEVHSVKIESVPNTKGKMFTQMTVVHTNLGNSKMDGKKLTEFYTDKGLWSTLKDAKSGDTLSIEREKNDGGFWEWKSIARQDAAPAAKAATPATNTFIQRDDVRQNLIVRQSCLASATRYCAANGGDEAALFNLAEAMVTWVNQTGVAGLVDNLPE